MEVIPVILNNVIYDTHLRRFYCSEKPPYPLRSFNLVFPFLPLTDVSGAYEVNRPTYITNYHHTCIGHAYLDFTIPLLSILYEYSPEILSKRGFQLFILKDSFKEYTTDPALIEFIDKWERNTVDFTGSYKGAYQHFHKCFSDSPILFEKSCPRYIRFSTIIYGGNEDWQRAFHNCNEKFVGRREVPVATDEQLMRWNTIGAEAFSKYIERSPKKGGMLLVARKETRAFARASLTKLSWVLNTEPVFLEEYSFQEQVQLFTDADIVVGAHGSGLCHLIWCEKGTKVIEIFAGNDRRKGIFESLSKLLKFNYTRIECSEEDTWDDPFEVPEWVISNLRLMLSSS
jgi:hypothetical protein